MKNGIDQVYQVKTIVKWIKSGTPKWEKVEPSKFGENIYNYSLHLNKNGDIIGGDWPSKVADRPDFLWWTSRPRFDQGLYALESIYTSSIGENQISRFNKDELNNKFKTAVNKIISMNKIKRMSKSWSESRAMERKKYYELLMKYNR